ncbi:unannotated protein [freshwater metagenome]|uniref:Unannotated protein n=1 Tax=freshwater metagenome TaxID=449393 RepID=A0A6J7F037_9ZZZZ
MMARGMVFCGFFTSSPAVETASRPMNEKKMVPAAAVTPAAPSGMKSEKLPESKAVNPTTANSASTPSLMTTMTAFTAADSLAPRMSNTAHRTISTTAGRFRIPGSASPGAADNACGMVKPKRLPRSSLRYPLQPTATAALDTPYSSSRQAATPIATTSPIVTYA